MEESIKQLALLSSVLGGFSFTFLSAVLLSNTEKKVKFWLIIGFGLVNDRFKQGHKWYSITSPKPCKAFAVRTYLYYYIVGT